MQRPLIGITPSYSSGKQEYTVNAQYCNMVDNCGGIPVICSYQTGVSSLLSNLSGLLLTGGGDISPLLFHEEPKPGLRTLSYERDEFELALCKAALKRKMPLFGICRGAQVMAVASGGSVWQDLSSLPDVLLHMQDAERAAPFHSVILKRDGYLSHLLALHSATVNSFHHQAIHLPGEGFDPVAWAPDGVIEAIFHQSHPFALGVQWHPEHLAAKDQKQKKLFAAFVFAAKKYTGGTENGLEHPS